ncbi:DUF2167 domain-containing protein [Sedimenticola sp.]|uniref:DUF2167 domain-containing protein n=1 Tax=Sedimenticola sp. TaxID=1940285 RepID=UPI003D0B5385
MRAITIALSCLLILFTGTAFSKEETLSAEQEQYLSWAKNLWQSLDRKQGNIQLPNKVASLQVPDDFYYLNPDDAEKILVDVWNNPPGAGKETLGMLLPSASSPFDGDSWAVTISYEEDGYVSDEDADNIDYQELLQQMQESTREENKARIRQGYESIELIGWAATPYYDKSSHKLHWAKELKFGDEALHTLNYNIRILGRKGVLVLNFIAGMDQREMIESQLGSVLTMANFDTGSRYSDFDPSLDKVAAYGIGALVAGKVIAKTGLLAAGLIFLKKFGVIILVGAGVLIKKLFSRKTA